jgi:hypothetical protein
LFLEGVGQPVIYVRYLDFQLLQARTTSALRSHLHASARSSRCRTTLGYSGCSQGKPSDRR